ncbi:hypothetical protein [Pseudonocardia sp. D17]|nr:hypothetical protein PSD17_56330 [Pseudonocardia sp. D17]
MLALIVAALIVWVVLAVLGFTIKGLLWLAVIACVLFVITGALGALRSRR